MFVESKQEYDKRSKTEGKKVSVPPADDEEDEDEVSSSKCAKIKTLKCLIKVVRVRKRE